MLANNALPHSKLPRATSINILRIATKLLRVGRHRMPSGREGSRILVASSGFPPINCHKTKQLFFLATEFVVVHRRPVWHTSARAVCYPFLYALVGPRTICPVTRTQLRWLLATSSVHVDYKSIPVNAGDFRHAVDSGVTTAIRGNNTHTLIGYSNSEASSPMLQI